jgi:phosphoribosylformimino-5-aminoimidazole carboxamide ribotide isomerase
MQKTFGFLHIKKVNPKNRSNEPMSPFTLYPAIDLRKGRVVRLRTGDPAQQIIYSTEPARMARQWLDSGAAWLHVVNLDAALGEDDSANQYTLVEILQEMAGTGLKMQLGGGMRSLEAIQFALDRGVERVVLGTAAALQPELVYQALKQFGAGRIAAGLDARGGLISVRGWVKDTPLQAIDLASGLAKMGMLTLIFTDIARDGVGQGGNLEATRDLALASGLEVIASGGFTRLEELLAARQAGLAGVILGKALYEGQLDLKACLKAVESPNFRL